MGSRDKKTGDAFNKTSIAAIVVIVFIISTYALDLLFHLGWGYKISDLKVGLIIFFFALVLRYIGLKMIKFFEGSN
jgi:hypothetical protein